MDNARTTFDPTQWVNNPTQQQGTPVPAACGRPQSGQVNNQQPTTGSQQPMTDYFSADIEKARAVCDELLRLGANIAESYDDYLKLGFALADGLGAEGRDIYHQLCAQSTKYREGDCEKKWQECLSKKDGRTTIKTFYMMAQQAGVDLSAMGRRFPSNPQHPHTEGEVMNNGKMGISKDSPISPQGEGTEGTEGNQLGDEEAKKLFSETFSDKIDLEAQSPMIRQLLSLAPDATSRDKMMLSAITTLSGAMPGVYGIYDDAKVYPPIYIIFHSPPSNSKGKINACRHLLSPLVGEMEKAYEQAQEEYEQQMAAYLTQDKKSRSSSAQPKEPPYRSPFIPANSSATVAYQALGDNHGWGVIFETEADTLTAALNSDYGNYSDGLRKAFHHEVISYNRRKDNEHVYIPLPRLSILLTCTPGQIPKLLPSEENGFASRFLFYGMARDLEWRNPFQRKEKTLEEQMVELGQRYLDLFHELEKRQSPQLEFTFSEEQQQRFNVFFNALQTEQFHILGDGLIPFVRRLGLVCFRIAMVLTVLRCEERQPMINPLSQTLVCNDTDFQTAMTIANCLINHTAHVYANLIPHSEQNDTATLASLNASEKRLLQALPQEFTTKEAMAKAQQLGIPQKSSERYLGNFVSKYHCVTRVTNGHYRKM
ncbi:MAG: DUF3987 domain-containing protein [Bacteroidales bacterium]|nr:DUF3987 domain-containing protein [Bacteroidales bacterium]